MTARTNSINLSDGDTVLAGVRCEITSRATAFSIDGLPAPTAHATANRLRAAFKTMGLSLPAKIIWVAIEPTDPGRNPIHYDLPIAICILAAMNIIPTEEAERHVCLGGLSTNGLLTPVDGVLQAAIMAATKNYDLICPYACGAEAAWVGSVQVIAPKSLLELVNHFNGHRILDVAKFDSQRVEAHNPYERETVGGRQLLNIGNTRCLYMDGLIYPIVISDDLDL